MGNNSSNNNPEAMDSRVIKISESVAQRLLVQKDSSGRIVAIDNTQRKSESPKKAFKRDPSVIGQDVFDEFEKQEVLNELQMSSLNQKLRSASKGFSQAPVVTIKSNAELGSPEQSKVLACLKSNDKAGLNCQAEILDFVSLVENNSYPVSAQ